MIDGIWNHPWYRDGKAPSSREANGGHERTHAVYGGFRTNGRRERFASIMTLELRSRIQAAYEREDYANAEMLEVELHLREDDTFGPKWGGRKPGGAS